MPVNLVWNLLLWSWIIQINAERLYSCRSSRPSKRFYSSLCNRHINTEMLFSLSSGFNLACIESEHKIFCASYHDTPWHRRTHEEMNLLISCIITIVESRAPQNYVNQNRTFWQIEIIQAVIPTVCCTSPAWRLHEISYSQGLKFLSLADSAGMQFTLRRNWMMSNSLTFGCCFI